MPWASITLVHLSTSSAMNLANPSGVNGIGSTPNWEELLLHHGIGQGFAHRVAELFDDLGGRSPGGRAEAIPAKGIVARHELADGRHVR